MLTLNDLSKTLAEMTGCQSAEADDFLRELFAIAAETLGTHGRVEVPLIGLFTIKDTAIQFLPDPELAAEINTPFADFTPIEVPADFTLTESQAADPVSEPAAVPELVPVPEPSDNSNSYQAPNPSDLPPDLPPEIPPYNPPAPAPDPVPTPVLAEGKTRRSLGCCRAMLIGLICAIVGFAAGWFASQYYTPKNSVALESAENDIPAEPSESSDGSDNSDGDSEAFEPADEPAPRPIVTDTVRPGRYLTTMAYRHYGQKEYWVYIYEANKQYGNPNALSTGTVLIIPPADSLGLVPGDKEKLAEAQRKLNEIWALFN